jgi:hypothetical protein
VVAIRVVERDFGVFGVWKGDQVGKVITKKPENDR